MLATPFPRFVYKSFIAPALMWSLACLLMSWTSKTATTSVVSSLSSLSLPRRRILSPSFRASTIFADGDVWEEDEEEPSEDSVSITSSDWVQAELTLRNAPKQPDPDLKPETVALMCCRSLQWIDYPSELAGLERCFDFFTFDCRKAVTARQGGQTVDRFCQYGILSPALQPFMGAHRVDVGNATLTKPQPPFRGALASFPVVIQGAPILSLQYPSGMNRSGIAATPPVTHMVLRLEQQRRPPNQGCWLVKEIMDVRHAFAGDMGNAHVGG